MVSLTLFYVYLFLFFFSSTLSLLFKFLVGAPECKPSAFATSFLVPVCSRRIFSFFFFQDFCFSLSFFLHYTQLHYDYYIAIFIISSVYIYTNAIRGFDKLRLRILFLFLHPPLFKHFFTWNIAVYLSPIHSVFIHLFSSLYNAFLYIYIYSYPHIHFFPSLLRSLYLFLSL